MKRRLILVLVLAAELFCENMITTGWSQAPATVLSEADAALQAGETDKALVLLAPLSSAEAHNLECRVRFTLQQWDLAVRECESAVSLDMQSSDDHMWLGRALGQKADSASFLTAFTLAKRVRTEFEQAVQLDSRNAAALADLGAFYCEAPSIVGGGLQKAEEVAAQLARVNPARSHQLRGRIAEARKDYTTAEREFKQAILTAEHPAPQWMNLAMFYQRHKQWEDMEASVRKCGGAAGSDRQAAIALYDCASLLMETNRNPQLATRMLEEYLASSAKTEEGPAFLAHIRLGRLEQQLGNTTDAQREWAIARAMAREFNPAQDERH